MQPGFVEAVKWYNSLVPPYSPEGVPLRVPLHLNQSVRENLRSGKFWEVLPFTDHSTILIDAVSAVAERSDWMDVCGVLFWEFECGATPPTHVSITDPLRVVGGMPGFRVRAPIYVWLFMRMHEQPGLNSYPVVADTPEAARAQRTVLSPYNQVRVRKCIQRLATQGILKAVMLPYQEATDRMQEQSRA